MLSRFPLIIGLGVLAVSLPAQQDSVALRFAGVIQPGNLAAHLHVLAHDSLEGRDTGKPGQKKAAHYLREQFASLGIPPLEGLEQGYFQPFELVEVHKGTIGVSGRGRDLRFMQDMLYFNEVLAADRTVKELIYVGEQVPNGTKVPVWWMRDSGEGQVFNVLMDLRMKSGVASRSGAEVLFLSTVRMQEVMDAFGHYAAASRMMLAEDAAREEPSSGLQVILVDEAAFVAMLGTAGSKALARNKPGMRVRASLRLTRTEARTPVFSENVLAYVEGSDLKDELVVITAHYDHVGVEDGEVYNGADDDGSGTVALLGIAEAFAAAKAQGKGPRRSVLIMPVSAEEKGLLGSKYYSEHPVFPLENTVANLNIDMIGRVDSAHQGMAPYVYVIGSDRLSTELHAINEEANRWYTRLELDYRFNTPDDPNRFYYRSDHYNFARKGVPAIFYFSGVHEDYHQPGDDVEKISFDLLHQRALLVFHTAWMLANRDERPVVDGKVE